MPKTKEAPKSEVEQVKEALLKKSQPNVVPVKDLLGTGATLLNLGCSGKTFGGLAKGTYNLFVGDTDSGKSLFSRAFMAEAAMNPAFDGYNLIYDDVERAALINTARFFGRKAAGRIKLIHSTTVEDMYAGIITDLKKGKPFIRVVDSETSLSCDADVKRAEAVAKKKATGEGEVAGSFGVEKAKAHSQMLRQLMGPLKDTNSILVIVNQTRDNIGFGSQFNPKVRPGGNALEFYATVQMWSSVRQKLTTTYKGKQVETGIRSKIKVKRSRLTGRQIEVEIPIYWSSGIDDVGSMVDWLCEWKHWGGKKGEDDKEIIAPEFDFTGKREALIRMVQADEREPELQGVVAKVWEEIESACSIERKSRYE